MLLILSYIKKRAIIIIIIKKMIKNGGSRMKVCRKGVRLLGYTIIVLVGGIIGISYYAVVGLTWAPLLFNHGLANTLLSFLLLFLFHLLLGMLLWCYLMVVFSDPGSVPDNWKPLGEDVEEGNLEERSMPLSSYVASSESISVSNSDERRNIDIGETEYCTRCGNVKPPRCHHCSVCQRCVLKMDHHCIWLVNCVGARNYKFFLLFLLYTFAETTLDVLILMPSVVKLFREGKFHTFEPGDLTVTLLAFLLNVVFALCLLCFVGMHASLLSTNTTSIEVHLKRKDVRWMYDLGRNKNFEQVFGGKKAFWLLPLYAREDLENIPALQGLDFPTRPDIEV